MEEFSEFPAFNPEQQVSFFYRLSAIKEKYLSNALKQAVESLEINQIDNDLNRFVPPVSLRRLAAAGLRGEVIFPVPVIIESDPHLLGYYRLLLGFSQKEFYSKKTMGIFRSMEEKGIISVKALKLIDPLCKSLIKASCFLLEEIDELSPLSVYELQLLTIGPQLRGAKNNDFGKAATVKTFDLIKSIVEPYLIRSTNSSLILENSSGRKVRIEFASDPDIQIIEEMKTGERGLISIEIKGGKDVSNIHNRIGEAEKSHQKAKKRGYNEFMTIVSVDVDYETLKEESPTTSHFFHLDRISDRKTSEFGSFQDILISILNIDAP